MVALAMALWDYAQHVIVQLHIFVLCECTMRQHFRFTAVNFSALFWCKAVSFSFPSGTLCQPIKNPIYTCFKRAAYIHAAIQKSSKITVYRIYAMKSDYYVNCQWSVWIWTYLWNHKINLDEWNCIESIRSDVIFPKRIETLTINAHLAITA